MPKNIPETTRFGYNNEEYKRSYSRKNVDLRSNEENNILDKDNFKINDIEFNSTEQALMFSKAKHFNDNDTANKILESNSPSESKELGGIVKNFDKQEWNNVSEKYISIILKHKLEDKEQLKNLENKIFTNENVSNSQQNNNKEILETLKKNKDFVDKVDEDNSKRQKIDKNKIIELSQELKYSNENFYNQSYETKNAISELSFKEKMDLYNQAKDIDNMTDYDVHNNIDDISNQLQTKLIINEIENNNDNEVLNSLRKDYLVSETPKPATKDLNFENSSLKNYLENSNKEISNLNKPKLDKFIENANNEIKHINYNEQANKIKNNNVFKQYYSSDKFQSQSQNKANENKDLNQHDEEKVEKSKEKKNRLQR